jgi:DNA-binding NarL/FixJ family response regulator
VLIERENEIASAGAALDEARTGHGGVLIVSGPFGIGRSALLRSLSETAPGVTALRASGAPSERDIGLGVVRQLLDPAGIETSPEGLFALAADRPVLLLVDELQWADQPSLRWFAELSGRLSDSPVVLVAACRDGEPPTDPAAYQRILDVAQSRSVLRPLSLSGIGEVVAECFGEPGEPEFVAACQSVSLGRPLLLTAILHRMRDTGHRPRADTVGQLRSLRPSVIGDRAMLALSLQPRVVRDVTRAIAVLGEQAGDDEIADLSGAGTDGCARSMRTLAELGVLGSAGFVHPVLRDAVENALGTEELSDWQLRAARSREARGCAPEVVARHLLAAGESHGEGTAGVLQAAGRGALDRGDAELAIRCLRRALLESPEAGAERSALLADLATAERSGRPVASLRHLAQAVPRLEPSHRKAKALSEVPPILLGAAPPALLASLDELAGELGYPGSPELAELEPAMAVDARVRCARLSDPALFADTVRKFGGLAGRLALDGPSARDRVAVLLYASTLAGSHVDGVVSAARQVLLSAPPRPATMLTAVPLAARALVAADHGADADAWLAPLADAACTRCGEDAAESLVAQAERSYVLLRTHRYAEAIDLAAKTAERADPALTPVVSRCLETLAVAAIEARLPASALHVLADFRDDAQVPAWIAELVRGALALHAGSSGPALEHLLESGRELDRMGWTNPAVLPWRSWVAVLYPRLGKRGVAADFAADEYRRATSWGSPTTIGRALRVWGMVTDTEGGVELFRRAIGVLDDTAGALELAKAHLLLGKRLRATDQAEAARHLRSGERLAGACGVPDLDPDDGPGTWLPADSAGSLDSPVPDDPDRGDTDRDNTGETAETEPAGLTRSELRIAWLVVGGLSNQRIAGELGVTCRAVEKHLTKVYRKLGVTGRSGLADVLEVHS